MEKVLLQILSGKDDAMEPIKEYEYDRRLALEYAFYKPDMYNSLHHNFLELLNNDPNKAIRIGFKIFDKVRDHYQSIIDSSVELLKLENLNHSNATNFRIFNDMILFKDEIIIPLNDEWDEDHQLKLHHIKLGNWKPHCYNKLCFCLIKADIMDIKNDKSYPLFIFADNYYYSIYKRKEHTWYKKLWVKIKWKFIHHHKYDAIYFNEKEIWEK